MEKRRGLEDREERKTVDFLRILLLTDCHLVGRVMGYLFDDCVGGDVVI